MKGLKKMLKVIGIVILVIIILFVVLLVKNYIDSRKPYIKDNYYEAFKSNSILEKKYAGFGSFEVSNVDYKSNNKSIDKIRVWYPIELENNNKIYPTIVVVNASNTKALNYEPFFKRLASWGFVVVGNEDGGAGTGETTSLTLDYILGLDSNSIFYGKIDKENIGIIGYSQGGAGALRALTMYENGKNYKAIFTGSATYPYLAKNMGWEYDISKVNIPYFMTSGTGSSDDSGVTDIETEFGGVSPLKAQVQNYDTIPNNVLKIRARAVGAEHGDMLTRTDAYMTAWMLYNLQNDEEAGKVFTGENAEILSNSNWQDIEKNF